MFGSAPRELPHEIGLVLIPNFSMIAFTSAIEPLRLANRSGGGELYAWRLFSVDGRRVAALLDQRLPAGSRQVAWDGRDRRGRKVTAGAYYYRLVVDGAARGERVVLLP